MLIKHTRWETLEDPLVAQALVWSHAFFWVPLQTATYQVDELRVGYLSQFLHDVLESVLLFLVCDDFEGRWNGRVIRFELFEKMFSSRAAQNASIWHANHINYQLYLLSLISAREEGKAREKLDHDASEGPHVDLLSVGEDAKHNVRCSIEPTLNICVDDFVFQASTAEVSYCDSTLVLLFHQNVLRLQIAVDNAEVFKVAQPR